MRVLVFDYDGVISDSEEIYIGLFNRIGHKYDLPKIKNKDNFSKFFNGNFYEVVVKMGMPQEKMPDLIEESKKEMSEKSIPLFEGAKEMLLNLSKRNVIFIVTSNITKIVEYNLKKNNITCIKDVIGGDKEISKTKKILSIRKKFPDAKIYYIGDTVGDMREGKEAGVNTVAVTWGIHNKEKLEKEQPDIIVYSIDALEKIFI